MTDEIKPPIGMRFVMRRDEDITDRGVVTSRLRAGQAYAVTAANRDQVAAWLQEGTAVPALDLGPAKPAAVDNGGDTTAGASRVTGQVKM